MEIIIVSICKGVYEDYIEHVQFVTFDGVMAENWVNRYNKIVDDNYNKMLKYYENGDYDKPALYCYDYIYYDKPMAKMEKVEFRATHC